jgi:demethylmacrocin O-methyltransferase
MYVCEDLQTSYWAEFGGSSEQPDGLETSMGFFKSLVHCLNHVEYRVPGYAPSEYDRTVTAIHFYHNMVFIRKAHNDEASFDGRYPGQ